MASTSSNSFVNSHWRQILFSITQRNGSSANDSSTNCPTKNGRRGPPLKFWLLTCCVTPKSEVCFYIFKFTDLLFFVFNRQNFIL